MRKMWKVILLTATIIMGIAGIASAATTLETDVATASSGCKIVGLEGQFIADCQVALDRMNEIRKEACDEGVINPVTGKKLTSKDYVPLKWSSDMEAIARIRAAESAITMDHIRTNGKSCFAIKSNGKASSGEVIAWNFSKTMVNGVNQWYREKTAYVKKTGGVTGHYEAMIDPTFTYVGLGTFYTTDAEYYNTTVGEFSASKTALTQTMGTSTSTVVQKLEIKTSASYYTANKNIFKTVAVAAAQTTTTTTSTPKVQAPETKKEEVKAPSMKVSATKATVKKGKTTTLKVTTENTTDKVTYATSNKKIATVSAKGVIKGVKKGSAVVTVKCGDLTSTVKVTVKA